MAAEEAVEQLDVTFECCAEDAWSEQLVAFSDHLEGRDREAKANCPVWPPLERCHTGQFPG